MTKTSVLKFTSGSITRALARKYKDGFRWLVTVGTRPGGGILMFTEQVISLSKPTASELRDIRKAYAKACKTTLRNTKAVSYPFNSDGVVLA
jgi:hypothetical protein